MEKFYGSVLFDKISNAFLAGKNPRLKIFQVRMDKRQEKLSYISSEFMFANIALAFHLILTFGLLLSKKVRFKPFD